MIDHSRLRKARGPLTALVLLVAVAGVVLMAPPAEEVAGPGTAGVKPGATADVTTRPSASGAPSTSAAPGSTAPSGEDVEVAALAPTWPDELAVTVVEDTETRYRAQVAGGMRVLEDVLGALAEAGWGAVSDDGKSWTLTGTSSGPAYTGSAKVSGDVVSVTLEQA